MKFIWDPKKNRLNIKLHGIDFADVVDVFSYPMLSCIDNRFDYKEERWVGIGIMKGVLIVVIYTEDDEKEIIRIISARKATKNETKSYKEKLK